MGEDIEIDAFAGGGAALASLGTGDAAAIVIIGPGMEDMSPADFLAALRDREHGVPAVFLLAPAVLPDDDERHIHYVLGPDMAPEHVRALILGALRQPPARPPAARQGPAPGSRLERVLEIARRLAVQRDLGGASGVVVEGILDSAAADRGHCLYHDAEGGALWTEMPRGDDRECSTARGLAGFAARTGAAVCVERAGDDPRYRAGIDDPGGDGSERILAQPVIGADREVHAVLIAVRRASSPPFQARERGQLALLATHVAPMLELVALHLQTGAVPGADEGEEEDLFLREALDARAAWDEPSDVIRMSPRWVARCYRVLALALAALTIYVTFGTIHEYSTGPAVIRMSGRTELTATIAGTIAGVEVVPGQRVAAGDILLRLHDADAAAELARLREELEARLRSLLLEPGNEPLRQTVAALRTQRERAESRLEERLIRAPAHGTVSDVRIRPGQALAPGDLVVSLVNDDSDLSLIALLPGGDRPLLRPGMPIRLELSGYRHAYQSFLIDSVADEVIGPAEARRFLGQAVADSVHLAGPMVVVTARLPRTTFDVDGARYRFHDGMQGIADARVRSVHVWKVLIPGLRRL